MPRHPQRSGQPTEPFVVRFDAHVQAVPEMRRDFVMWMRAAQLDDDIVDDLEVVFSEVAANAVAASPRPTDQVRALALLDDMMLVLEMSNRVDGADRTGGPSLVVPDLDDPLRPSGRGLMIARAFVDSIDIEVDEPDGLLVRCCKRVSLSR